MEYKESYITYCNKKTYNRIKKFLPNAVLLLCFGLSNTNAALADQTVNISPIIVQPEDLRSINQQMLEQDRINRDQELAIRGLIDDNQKLTDTALARQQDAALEKINQTMKNYSNALLSRDEARILTNSQKVSKYHDLVVLTEDVDGMKGYGHTLQLKSDVIEEKYKILTELKDEMTALNEKLKGEEANENFSKTSPQQEDKVQFLTQRLGEMDQKISHYDEILAEKDRQIAELKDTIKDQEMQIGVLQGRPKSAAPYNKGSASMDLSPIVVDTFGKAPQVSMMGLRNKLYQQSLELKAKNESIRWLNQVLAVAKDKAEFYKLSSLKKRNAIYPQKAGIGSNDLVNLAKQLIALQQEEASLLVELKNLWQAQNSKNDQHVQDLQIRVSKKVQQLELLKSELEDKITAEKGQGVLNDQIQDLKSQLQDKDNQINALRMKIRSGQGTGAQTDSLKRQLADQQDKVESLNQQLENKINDSNKMTAIISDYQKKLESKDNAYNNQLGQIADLNAQLQVKEAQLVNLQASASAKEKEDQSKELSLSLVQQNTMDAKLKEYQDKIRELKTDLALARQQLEGMPSSDEIAFLRAGLQKATKELNQKDVMLTQAQTNADEYEKDFRGQTLDYQNLKGQLQSTYQEISQNNKELKDKDLEITRLKENYAIEEGNLQDAEKKLKGKFIESNMEASLEAQVKQKDALLLQVKANAEEYQRKYKEQSKEFKSLKEQLQDAYDEISHKNEDLKYKNLEILRLKERSHSPSPPPMPIKKVAEIKGGDDNVLREKLKQALDEIDEQGRVITVLAQKLQDAGQTVNLSQYLGKQ